MSETQASKEPTKSSRISDLLEGADKSSESVRALSVTIKVKLLGQTPTTGKDSEESPEPGCFFDEVTNGLYRIQYTLSESIALLQEVNNQLIK